MILKEEIVEIGKFQKAHALKGELNAVLEIPIEFIEEENPLIIEVDGIPVPFFAESVRKKGSTSFLLKLKGIDSEEDAKKFVNKVIYALKDKLKTFYEEEGEEFLEKNSLIGFNILDSATGQKIGEIIDIDDSTVNILLHVKTSAEEIIYIPIVEDWILDLDEENKLFKMMLPEGLIELNSREKQQ